MNKFYFYKNKLKLWKGNLILTAGKRALYFFFRLGIFNKIRNRYTNKDWQIYYRVTILQGLSNSKIFDELSINISDSTST